MNRLIFAGLGFLVSGFNFFGAMVGYAVGYLFEVIQRSNGAGAEQAHRTSQSYQYRGTGYNPYESPFYRPIVQENDFISVLLVLSASVIKADGRVLKAELDYLKDFFNRQFGNRFTVHHLQYLKEVLERPSIDIVQICSQLRYQTTEEVRIQLIHYLFGIAKADSTVSDYEMDAIYRISRQLHISEADFQSVKNMFYHNPQSDYLILGIDENATDEQVKKAYRQMAIKFHPDKVQNMGEEVKKAATEKFQKVQEAYENIKKARGIK